MVLKVAGNRVRGISRPPRARALTFPVLVAKEILLGMVNQPSHCPDGGDPLLRWRLLCGHWYRAAARADAGRL